MRDYLFESALPSYAKQFISFQALAERHPAQVRLVPYEQLMAKPVEVLAGILDHLSGTPRERPALADAVWLARREHMKAIEKELGRSLDGTRIDRGSHISQVTPGRSDARLDEQHAQRGDGVPGPPGARHRPVRMAARQAEAATAAA